MQHDICHDMFCPVPMHFWPLFPAAALASQWDAEFYRSPLRRLGVVHGLTRGWDNFFGPGVDGVIPDQKTV